MYLISSGVLFLLYVIKLEFFAAFFILSLSLIFYILNKRTLKIHVPIVLMFMFFCLFYSFLSPYNSYFFKISSVLYLLYIILIFLYREKINYKAIGNILRLLFNFNLLFFMSMFVWSLFSGYSYRIVWEQLPFGVSVNYYMSMFLVLTIYLGVKCNSSKDKFLVALASILMIATESRVVSVVAIMILIYAIVFKLKLKVLLPFILASSIGVVVFIIANGGDLSVVEIELYQLFDGTRFLSKGLDSPRFDMVNEYLASIGNVEFIFGSDFIYSPTIMMWDYNPHNSFIRAHSAFGLLSFIMFLVYLFVICRLFPKSRILIPLSFFYMAFYFSRALFDSVLIFSSVDLVLVLSLLSISREEIDNFEGY